MSVNKVILLGYVGNDPEIRYPEKDRAIAHLSLATNETTGKGIEKTEWHRLVFFGEAAQIVERYVKKGTQLYILEQSAYPQYIERYVKKGTQLYIEGKLTTREYEDRMKIVRKVTEIIVSFFEIVGKR